MFADNQDMHKSSQEVEELPDPTSATAELAALERLEKFPWTGLIMGKPVLQLQAFSAVFFILFKLTGNNHIHEGLGELNIRPDLTTDYIRLKFDVATFSCLPFIRSIFNLQVSRTCINI